MITLSIPNMVPKMPIPMVIIPMVVISMSSLAKKETNNLGNMHNKNIKGDYYIYHLFYLFLQFCEAFKLPARQHLFKMFNLVIY